MVVNAKDVWYESWQIQVFLLPAGLLLPVRTNSGARQGFVGTWTRLKKIGGAQERKSCVPMTSEMEPPLENWI